MKIGLSISGAAICELNEYYVCHTTLKFNVHVLVTSLPSPFDSESSLCAFHMNGSTLLHFIVNQKKNWIEKGKKKKQEQLISTHGNYKSFLTLYNSCAKLIIPSQ